MTNLATSAYESGHIPGAVGRNWQQDTQDTLVRDIPGRQAFKKLLSRSGIAADTLVRAQVSAGLSKSAQLRWFLDRMGQLHRIAN